MRYCSKCEVRHEPPTGNRCKRNDEEFRRLNEEMGETQTTDREDNAVKAEEEAKAEKRADETGVTITENEEKTADGARCQETVPEYDLPSFTEYRRLREVERSASRGPEGSGAAVGREESSSGPSAVREEQPGFYYQVPWQFVPPHLRDLHQYPPMFRGDPPAGFGPRLAPDPQQPSVTGPAAAAAVPEPVSGVRPSNLEGVMELMIESQREQMKMQTEILQSLRASTSNPPMSQQQASSSGANVDSSSSDSEGETEEWK